MSYLEGAYRRHHPRDVARFTSLAEEAFPELRGRIECFGADWLGTQFAVDNGRIVSGKSQVLILEPGTGEALQVPVDQNEFHDILLVTEPEAIVAHSFYRKWLATGGSAPEYDQCVGYRQPLYLSGVDDVSNLAITNFEVYWDLAGQLLAQVRRLPPGTPIQSVLISD